MTSFVVYGFSGKAGSGKDYVAKRIFPAILKAANILGKNEKILYLAFADLLKTIVSAKYSLSYEELYHEKSIRTRFLLQNIGDELRKKNGEDFFIKAIQIELMKHAEKSGITTFILTDVRFPEEHKWIKNIGGFVFRIDSPEREHEKLLKECDGNVEDMKKRSQHRSETLLDDFTFDAIIKNNPSDNPAQYISDWVTGKSTAKQKEST
jgi:hypothetical protein